jgi:hypothetical protein
MKEYFDGLWHKGGYERGCYWATKSTGTKRRPRWVNKGFVDQNDRDAFIRKNNSEIYARWGI